jgi:hypothetical protein
MRLSDETSSRRAPAAEDCCTSYDHDDGPHVREKGFIDMLRRKTKEPWHAVKAFEDGAMKRN